MMMMVMMMLAEVINNVAPGDDGDADEGRQILPITICHSAGGNLFAYV